MILSLQIVTLFVAAFMLLTSFLPILPWQHWVFRATEYPGLQKCVISLLCATALYFLYPHLPVWVIILIAALVVNAALLVHKFFPYLPIRLKGTEVKRSDKEESTLRILIGNVLQPNENYENYINQIEQENTDCFTLVEVNEKWVNEVKQRLGEKFPFQILEPLDNLYGMAFFSKHPIKNFKTEYLVKDDIPSMKCDLIKDGTTHHIQIVHPQPPSPTESNYSINKDKELMILADRMKDMKQPRMVIGDFNDVAWSKTTRLFQKISRLLDPRKGRGFYSTFHAAYWFMRFPLDHIFVSDHYSLVEMKRLQAYGSDHFPMIAEMACDHCSENVEPEEPNQDEKEEAEELKQQSPTDD